MIKGLQKEVIVVEDVGEGFECAVFFVRPGEPRSRADMAAAAEQLVRARVRRPVHPVRQSRLPLVWAALSGSAATAVFWAALAIFR